MAYWVWAIVGFIIGGSVGLLVAALLAVGREKE